MREEERKTGRKIKYVEMEKREATKCTWQKREK